MSSRDIPELHPSNTGSIDISNNFGTSPPNIRIPIPIDVPPEICSRGAKQFPTNRPDRLYVRGVIDFSSIKVDEEAPVD